MTSETLHYPTAIKKRVLGDWNCVSCLNLNFSFRDTCNRCGALRQSVPEAKFHYALFLTPREAPEETQDRGEDWEEGIGTFSMDELPSVSPFLNEKCMTTPTEARPISSRLLHFETAPNFPSDPPSRTRPDLSFLHAIKRPSTAKEGDWVCVECLNFNFAFRTECNRCGAVQDRPES